MKLLVTQFPFLLYWQIYDNPHHKTQWKVNFTFSIELFTFYLSSSAKLKTCFSWEENLKKCISFEKQKGTKYIQENIYFEIIVFSSLFSTKPSLEFLLFCLGDFYQISWGNEVDFMEIMYASSLWPSIKNCWFAIIQPKFLR